MLGLPQGKPAWRPVLCRGLSSDEGAALGLGQGGFLAVQRGPLHRCFPWCRGLRFSGGRGGRWRASVGPSRALCPAPPFISRHPWFPSEAPCPDPRKAWCLETNPNLSRPESPVVASSQETTDAPPQAFSWGCATYRFDSQTLNTSCLCCLLAAPQSQAGVPGPLFSAERHAVLALGFFVTRIE